MYFRLYSFFGISGLENGLLHVNFVDVVALLKYIA